MANDYQRIVSTIAKLEGKKREVKIGDIREIIKCLVAIEAASRIQRVLGSEYSVGPLEGETGFVFDQLGRQAHKLAVSEFKRIKREQRKKK